MATKKKAKKSVKKNIPKGASKKVESKNEVVATEEPKELIQCRFVGDAVITEATDAARELFHRSAYGTMPDKKKVQLSFLETMYLLEKGTINLLTKASKPLSEEQFLKKVEKLEPNFFLRYAVFKDFRSRGYVIKTALKFGADFRVYERGVKPGEDHAKWVVFPVHEAATLTWHEFSSKNRVAHSTKKRLLLGVVDDEGCPTYYEVRWVRP